VVGRALSSSDDCSYHSALVSRNGIVEAQSWGIRVNGARRWSCNDVESRLAGLGVRGNSRAALQSPFPHAQTGQSNLRADQAFATKASGYLASNSHIAHFWWLTR
jgi:hypothetical protein